MISRHTDVANFQITVLASADQIFAIEFPNNIVSRVQNVDHSGVFALKSKRLKDEIIGLQGRNLDEAVAPTVVPEHVGK